MVFRQGFLWKSSDRSGPDGSGRRGCRDILLCEKRREAVYGKQRDDHDGDPSLCPGCLLFYHCCGLLPLYVVTIHLCRVSHAFSYGDLAGVCGSEGIRRDGEKGPGGRGCVDDGMYADILQRCRSGLSLPEAGTDL